MGHLKVVRLGVFAAALLAMGAAAGAQAPAPGGLGFGGQRGPMDAPLGPLAGHGRFWNNPAIVQKLNLTDDQRKAMDDIFLQHREALVDLRANLEKAELALEPLINADQLDESRILAQVDQVAQARAELFKANARFLLAIRGKLTSDQWKQVQNLRNERPEGFRRWRQGQPGPQATPPAPGGPQGRLDMGPGLDGPEPSGPGMMQ